MQIRNLPVDSGRQINEADVAQAAVGVLLAVGLIAGMVPAIKASRYDPIEALCYE